tara:strand:+ start:457 stop:633 length:177 start_codon:yes stop_codon:yes gene_type:complete
MKYGSLAGQIMSAVSAACKQAALARSMRLVRLFPILEKELREEQIEGVMLWLQLLGEE